MRTRRRATIEDLRAAIDCLPRATKIAMLQGIGGNEIIVGAYAGPDGICPMLAAHRAGGRTSFISFARAWDAFAFRGARKRQARRATERELLVLSTHLKASLLEEELPREQLALAIEEHRQLISRRGAQERAPQRTFRLLDLRPRAPRRLRSRGGQASKRILTPAPS